MLPQAHRLWGLSVFPIYPRPTWRARLAQPVRFTPLALALQNRQAQVLETERGVVLQNSGPECLLGLDGDRLEKRVLDASVLLGHGDTRLPASFVERGRWHEGAGRVFTSLLRQDYRGDQRCLWRDVVTSEAPGRAALQAYVEALPYPQHAVGLAVAVGGQLRGLDLFDQPATCQHYWPQLVRAAAAEAVTAPHEEAWFHDLLGELANCQLESPQAAGLGQEIRVAGATLGGKALLHGDSVIHLNLFVRAR